jgi:hypothetical protein
VRARHETVAGAKVSARVALGPHAHPVYLAPADDAAREHADLVAEIGVVGWWLGVGVDSWVHVGGSLLFCAAYLLLSTRVDDKEHKSEGSVHFFLFIHSFPSSCSGLESSRTRQDGPSWHSAGTTNLWPIARLGHLQPNGSNRRVQPFVWAI